MRKRLWIILGIVVAIAFIAVMSYCVFSIGKIDVDTTVDMAVMTKEEKSEIIEISGIREGKNIFAIDENIAKSNIELSMPTLKVISIERAFPNIVYIHVTRRTPVFWMLLDGGKYAILDRELKIIEISDVYDTSLTQIVGVKAESVALGEILPDSKVLLNLIKGAETNSFINARFSAFYRKVVVEENYIYLTSNTGVIFQLPISQNINESVTGSYGYYLNNASERGRNSGYIYLDEYGWYWKESL